jgi:lipopolysaccharide biosynthesis protein
MRHPRSGRIDSDDLCLFAHFDPDSAVDEHVFYYLGSLRQVGFRIVFVTTIALRGTDRRRLSTLCELIVERENAGFDFGSWAEAYRHVRGILRGRLLLANDSVYGPIGDFNTALDRLLAAPADVYGFVGSNQWHPHLQSWFLLLESWVATSADFVRLMERPFHRMTKAQIIEFGEIGLSECLLSAGYSFRAMSNPVLRAYFGQWAIVNPMHFFWRELIEQEQVPFLKVELLRDNPNGVTNLEAIPTVISNRAPKLALLIKEHQRRIHSPCHAGGGSVSIHRKMYTRLIRQTYTLSNRAQHGGCGRLFKLSLALHKLVLTVAVVLYRKRDLSSRAGTMHSSDSLHRIASIPR